MTENCQSEQQREILSRINQYRSALQEIMTLIYDRQFLTDEEKGFAQSRMKGIKRRLKADPDLAIRKAGYHIHAAWNSNPIKSNWLQQLGVALADIDLYLSRIKH